jgi:uncharacterized protein YbcI
VHTHHTKQDRKMKKSQTSPKKPTRIEVDLAATLSGLWESAHGAPPGNVRVLLGPDSVAIWIDAVLSPAEIVVARQRDGYLLIQRYTDELMGMILPDLMNRVRMVSGRQIVSSNSRVDVDNGNILCFFVLGAKPDRQSLPVNKDEDVE